MADFSVYPDAIDGYSQLPLVVDLVTRVDAVTVNRLRSAIINIENELGIAPSADFDSVRARLDALDSNVLGYKNPARVATTENISNLDSGAPLIVDGITLEDGDRVLVYQQDDMTENGIYAVETLGSGSNGVWIRAEDADSSENLLPGTEIFVVEGELNGLTKFWLITPGPYTLGTTLLEFVEGLTIMRSDAEPTIILTANDIGASAVAATPTDSIEVRNFKEIDFSFLVTNLDTITEIRARILYSLLESPGDYASAPEDWNILLAEGIVSGIATQDAYTLSLIVDDYPGFDTLPGSFAFRSPIAGLHMMVLIWAHSGTSDTSSFEGRALRRG